MQSRPSRLKSGFMSSSVRFRVGASGRSSNWSLSTNSELLHRDSAVEEALEGGVGLVGDLRRHRRRSGQT